MMLVLMYVLCATVSFIQLVDCFCSRQHSQFSLLVILHCFCCYSVMCIFVKRWSIKQLLCGDHRPAMNHIIMVTFGCHSWLNGGQSHVLTGNIPKDLPWTFRLVFICYLTNCLLSLVPDALKRKKECVQISDINVLLLIFNCRVLSGWGYCGGIPTAVQA